MDGSVKYQPLTLSEPKEFRCFGLTIQQWRKVNSWLEAHGFEPVGDDFLMVASSEAKYAERCATALATLQRASHKPITDLNFDRIIATAKPRKHRFRIAGRNYEVAA
jgi:hypothetical protein